jgi:hypothetical protein
MPLPETTLSFAWNFGDEVFLKVCDDCRPGLVTGYNLRPGGRVLYVVTWGDHTDSMHYAFELTGKFEPRYADN